MLRETKQDRINQERLFKVFAEKKGWKYRMFPSTAKKYRIDGYFYDDKNNVKCWVECKWYSGKAYLMLNVPKYNELKSLTASTFYPSILLFREGDKWGWIVVGSSKPKIKVMGGTPKGRTPNEDDIEPLVVFNRSDIVWGN